MQQTLNQEPWNVATLPTQSGHYWPFPKLARFTLSLCYCVICCRKNLREVTDEVYDFSDEDERTPASKLPGNLAIKIM